MFFCQRLETVKQEAPNLEAEEAKVQKEIDKTNAKRAEILVQYKDSIKVNIFNVCVRESLGTQGSNSVTRSS